MDAIRASGADAPRDVNTMENTLYLIRHAPTRLNDPEHERSRGWGMFPPDPEKLKELVPQIAEVLQNESIRRLVASDLPRAAVTARELGKEMGIPHHVTRQLRTWNTGGMTGKSEKEVVPLKKKYIEHPDLKPPDGEPFEAFEKRWGRALRQFMRHNESHPDDQVALVIHGNMDMSAPAIVLEEKVTAKHYDQMRPPGSISVLRWSKGTEPHIDVVNEGIGSNDGSRDADNSEDR
jgi:broad specificity phosphatase PhoE